MRGPILRSLIMLLLLGVVDSVPAVIINGDFSELVPLAGFTATGTVVAEPTGGFAQLETDATFIRTLEQTVALPATASTLFFDFAFSTEGVSPSAGFPDSLAVSLLTTIDGDFLDILVADLSGLLVDPSDGIEGITGALPIEVALDSGVGIEGFVPLAAGTTISGRISLSLPNAVLGEEATVFFDLFDEFDGFASIAALDNIAIVPGTVPEPTTIGLLLVALVGIAGSLRIQRVGRARE